MTASACRPSSSPRAAASGWKTIAAIGVDAVGLDWTTRSRRGAPARRPTASPCRATSTRWPCSPRPKAWPREARRVLDSFGQHSATSGHVFNLGHGISQHTPPDNVAVLVDTVRQYSRGFHGGTSARPDGSADLAAVASVRLRECVSACHAAPRTRPAPATQMRCKACTSGVDKGLIHSSVVWQLPSANNHCPVA